MLEQSQFPLPSNLSVKFLLAEAYAKAGREDDAIKTLKSVLPWTQESSAASKRVKKLLDSLLEPDGNEQEQQADELSEDSPLDALQWPAVEWSTLGGSSDF